MSGMSVHKKSFIVLTPGKEIPIFSVAEILKTQEKFAKRFFAIIST
jgi:hypothetical protein